MRNHNGKKDSGMKWMMLICCLLPLGLLLFAGGTLSSGGYLWPILFGVMIVAHLLMMFKRHGEHSDKDSDTGADSTSHTGGQERIIEKTSAVEEPKKDAHKHGGCCH